MRRTRRRIAPTTEPRRRSGVTQLPEGWRAGVDPAHLEPARGGLGQAPRRHPGRHRDARPPAPPRARPHLWAAQLAHAPPHRAERVLIHHRGDDASRSGSGRPRSSRGHISVSPSSASRTPRGGLARSRLNAVQHSRLGRLSHWPVLPRPRLAGFQVSTEVPRLGTRSDSAPYTVDRS